MGVSKCSVCGVTIPTESFGRDSGIGAAASWFDQAPEFKARSPRLQPRFVQSGPLVKLQITVRRKD